MGACVSQQTDQCDVTQALIVDVQTVIADYVWSIFRSSHSSSWNRRFRKRNHYTIDVPMNFYQFEKTKQELSIRNSDNGDSEKTCTDLAGKISPTDTQMPQSSKASVQQNSLKTMFRNDTGQSQTYSFSCEKSRQCSARVSCQRGFSFGASTDFSIGLPEILPGGEMGAEISMQLEVIKSEEQMFEETSTTTLTSDLTVSEHSQCLVDVILDENHFTADYKVYITMKMPSKKAEVYIHDKRGELIHTFLLENLSDVFPDHRLKNNRGQVRADAIQFVVEGVIRATQQSNQNILLNSQAL